MTEIGVLLMCYGAPTDAGDVERYYTDIRRGRPPSAEQLDDLRRRYDTIGGLSPLAERTRAQAAGVQRALDATAPGRYRVWTAAKHSPPFIEDGVKAAVDAGVTDLVAVVLAPHYSVLSVGEYLERVDAAAPLGMRVHPVRSWHLEPELVDALATRLRACLDYLAGHAALSPHTLVTAHSLPRRVLDIGDPYPQQLGETADAVTAAAGARQWSVAWQSAARTPEPWLGPDVNEAIDAAADAGTDAVVVCPAGFTSDHLEVLYDIDVVARATAGRRGLRFARTASLNDDPGLCRAVANVVMRAR